MVKIALRKLTTRYHRLKGPFRALVGERGAPTAARQSPRRRPILAWMVRIGAAMAAASALFVGGLIAGVVAEQNGTPDRIARRLDLEQRMATAANALGLGAGDVQTARWRSVVLNQHTLEWASIRIHPPGARGGALVEVAGFVVFSSPLGQFGYLSPGSELHPLALRAPTNVEAIRESPLRDHPLFMASEFRVHDLAARQSAPDVWDLYATLSRFEREDCYQFKIVRTQLTISDGALTVRSPGWQDVYTARPGCIPNKDRGWLFQGTEAGGRMAFLDEHTMLVSIGDHQLDGYNASLSVAMNPDWDLGKLVAIDLRTGASRIYASGLRNPQGLVVMRDGRIFTTEHGPQGGDEINFIREGSNYGWPQVSYGMNYGFPRSNWPGDPHPGGHSGFTRPAHAFVPAIGISNLVQPSSVEFPNWGDNDLLLLSLRAGTLFHVAVFEDRVAYVEPIEFNHRILGRERLRDIVTLSDARNVILTDSGRLIFLRNAERHADEPREFVVRGYSTLAAPLPEELFEAGESRTRRGQQYFQLSCASCHSLDGRSGIGPPLNGVVARQIAAIESYPYSTALSQHEGVWNEAALRSYITDPQHHVPGTAMPSPGVSWTMVPAIVDYLQSTRAHIAERSGAPASGQ